jgi:ribonucleoside-diphosphate reductase alpha chain
MTKEIFIVKRDGEKEPLDYEKINKVLLWATENIKNVNASDIALNAKLQIVDGMKSTDIHKVLIQSACDLISEEFPNYQYVASELLNFYIRKEVFRAQDNLPHIYEVIEKNVSMNVYDKKLMENYSYDDMDKINKLLRHKRDYNFTYAGLQQLIDKYLLKDRKTGELYETPQYMYMTIAMTLFSSYSGKERLDKISSFYNDISQFKISLPTPIMSGVRTSNRQYSSCVLINIGDSLKSIYSSNTAVGYYTAKRAGIGLNIGGIRAIGDRIRNGEVIHTGVVPFLKMFESTTKSCTQNGIRTGSTTTFFPFWHKEVEDILVLKNNRGSDDNRVRKMDYGIQLSRLFYKRFIENGNISLFSPGDVPELYQTFGMDNDKWDKLYEKLEKDKSIDRKAVKARDLMNSICQERIGTGRIYIMNIDHANTHSSFLDKIWQSNLCVEINLPNSPISHIDDGKIIKQKIKIKKSDYEKFKELKEKNFGLYKKITD